MALGKTDRMFFNEVLRTVGACDILGYCRSNVARSANSPISDPIGCDPWLVWHPDLAIGNP